MNKPTIEGVKNKFKTYAPAVATGIAFGATVATIIARSHYRLNENEAVIQLPMPTIKGLSDGRTLLLHSDHGEYEMKQRLPK